jgi:hypothetical protein
MNDIREVLSAEIENLRNDKTTPANLNAITNATGKILATVKLELEYAKMTNKKLSNGFIQLEEVNAPQVEKNSRK